MDRKRWFAFASLMFLALTSLAAPIAKAQEDDDWGDADGLKAWFKIAVHAPGSPRLTVGYRNYDVSCVLRIDGRRCVITAPRGEQPEDGVIRVDWENATLRDGNRLIHGRAFVQVWLTNNSYSQPNTRFFFVPKEAAHRQYRYDSGVRRGSISFVGRNIGIPRW